MYANRRQLPEVPDDHSSFKTSIDTLNTAVMSNNIDDDYAEIGPGGSFEEPKFDPEFELTRDDIELVGSPIGRGQFGNVHKAHFVRNGIKAAVAVKSTHFQVRNLNLKFELELELL